MYIPYTTTGEDKMRIDRSNKPETIHRTVEQAYYGRRSKFLEGKGRRIEHRKPRDLYCKDETGMVPVSGSKAAPLKRPTRDLLLEMVL